MEKLKKFAVPAALFAAGAIVATAFAGVRRIAAKVAQFLPGASLPSD